MKISRTRSGLTVMTWPALCAFCHHEVNQDDLTCYNCWPALRPKED